MSAGVPRLGFPRSLRFRLTAWYGLLLALVLLTLTVGVLTLAQQRLQADMDSRVTRTATDISSATINALNAQMFDGGPARFDEVAPSLGPFASRGLLIQIVDNAGQIVRASEYAPPKVMVAAPDPSAGNSGPVLRTTVVDGWEVRAVRYPLVAVDQDGQRWSIGAVLVGERTDTMRETLQSLRQALVWVSLAGLAVALLGGWAIAGRALRQVDRVTAAAAGIAEAADSPAALATRLPVPRTGDEIARLSATFNRMLDRLETAFRTQQRFVADASHELRTPLAAIRGNVDVLERQLTRTVPPTAARDDMAAAVTDIQHESARMARLLDDLLALARGDNATAGSAPKRPLRLDEVARNAVRAGAALPNGRALRLRAAPVTVVGDGDRLEQLTLILIDNALRHAPDGTDVSVVVARHGEQARLSVEDAGPGIAAEHVPRLFDRFFRVEDDRGRTTGGSGLGLAIARSIAADHGGTIDVDSAPGAGSCFTVRLPLAPAA